MPSLDPRFNRFILPESYSSENREEPLDQWQTWEVFTQAKRGDQHTHVGIVHAPNGEMALVLAKEQYTRREKCVNLWVVRTTDVVASDYDDSDMFDAALDKSYRESWGYKNREKLEEFQRRQEQNEKQLKEQVAAKKAAAQGAATQTGKAKPRIIVGKRK